MSQGNVEVVRALLGAFDRGDYEATLEGLDPEIEWHAPPGVTIGQEVYRGRKEVEKGFAEWLGPWDAHRFELEEMLDHGDDVVVCGIQIARGGGSGVEVRLPTFHVVTLRDGKITRHRSFHDRAEALEAAGLSE
jgi:ketosteroid isomerase-like protein